jgi:hypothetical protein
MLFLRLLVTLASLTDIPNRYRYPILYDSGTFTMKDMANITTIEPEYSKSQYQDDELPNSIPENMMPQYVNKNLSDSILFREENLIDDFSYSEKRLHTSSANEDKQDQSLFIYSLVGIAFIIPFEIYCIRSGIQLKKIALEYELAGGPSHEMPLIEQNDSNFVISGTIASSIYRSIALYSVRSQRSTLR